MLLGRRTSCQGRVRCALLAIAAIAAIATPSWGQPSAAADDSPAGGNSAAAAPADDEILAEIHAGWERRRAAIQAVEVLMEGTATRPTGSVSLDAPKFMTPPEIHDKPFPHEDYTYPVKVRLLVDFETNRIRTDRHDQIFYMDALQFRPTHEIWMYDGEHVQQLSPREGNTGMGYVPSDYQPELTYGKPPETSLYLTFDYEAVFLACGRLPVGSRASFDRFTQPEEPKAIEVHGRESYGGRDCILVRTASADFAKELVNEYWVDVERDAAVLRARLHRFGRLGEEMEIEYEAGDAGWMPVRIVSSSFGVSDPPRVKLSEELRVTSLVVDPPLDDAEFHVETEPGMIVRDRATGETHVYHGPDELQDVKEHYRESCWRRRRPRRRPGVDHHKGWQPRYRASGSGL